MTLLVLVEALIQPMLQPGKLAVLHQLGASRIQFSTSDSRTNDVELVLPILQHFGLVEAVNAC